MIRELMLAGLRLSGKPDPRLRQGLAWTTAEAFRAATMYPWLDLLLLGVGSGVLTSAAIAWCALGMLLCLGLRVECGRRGMPTLYAGAYAMMCEARLRVADPLRQLPMGWHARRRGGDLGARLTSGLELIEHIWSHFSGAFVVGIVTPLCLMAFLGWLAEPALAQPQRPVLPQGRDIRFAQVDFQYEGAQRPALQGVSCTIAANSLTAIVGPSGAGKSTLVHLIARLWDVSAGSIQGRLVEQGTHDQLLLRSGLYARLWERQMEARLWTMGTP